MENGITEWKSIELIDKGWSADKKYKVLTKSNEELLLKISDISKYESKRAEFEVIKSLKDKEILMPKAIDLGVWQEKELVYAVYTWINGEDAEERIKEFSKEKQYELGVVAGKYLKEIHSIVAPDDVEDWEIRFNRKIDTKIQKYKECGIEFNGAEKMINYLNSNIMVIPGRSSIELSGVHKLVRNLLQDILMDILMAMCQRSFLGCYFYISVQIA